MKHIVAALLASAVSLVGGHFVNRRWDRAVLFFALIVVGGIAAYVSTTVHLSAGPVDGTAVGDAFTTHFRLFGLGIAALWFISLVITVADARRPERLPAYPWTVSGRVGAIALSVLTSFLLATQAGVLLVQQHETRVAQSDADTPVHWPTRFSDHLMLGRFGGNDLPPPPPGDGYLRGRYTFDGRPAIGVKVSLVLNGAYQTPEVATDPDGIFEVRVPPGTWHVTRVETRDWPGKPEAGEFLVGSNADQKLTSEGFDEYGFFQSEGFAMTAGDATAPPLLELTLRPRVALRWPDATETRAALEQAAITWDPYPGATTYLVKITELEREGTTTSFHEVTRQVVSGTASLALAGLAKAPAEDAAEYHATVYAFAADGALLSRSGEPHETGTFTLGDDVQLVRDRERRVASAHASPADYAQIRLNNERIEAIETLLKADLVDEAERLLGRIEGAADPGRKAAITGYVLARRGRCAEAEQAFTQALGEGGADCVPSRYRAECKVAGEATK
jgi:hypothetical protein